MLSISVAQYAALQDHAAGQFHDRLARWLQANSTVAATMDRPALEAFIVRQEPRAARFGLGTERELAKWCWLSLTTGERFDRSTPIIAFLHDPRQGSTPGERLDAFASQFAAAADARDRGEPCPSLS